jgi:Prp8 binding protein
MLKQNRKCNVNSTRLGHSKPPNIAAHGTQRSNPIMPRGRRSNSSIEAPASKKRKGRSASTTSVEDVKVEDVEMEEEEASAPPVSQALVVAPGRSSSLHAPNMKLEGHKGQVYSLAFDPSGKCLASGSMDKSILLWDVFDETCTNYNVLKGHKNAVLQVEWLPISGNLISCSADTTVCVWDANKGKRLRKLEEHTGIVNSCAVAKTNPAVIVSGSDDCTATLWDIRGENEALSMFHDYQVTSVAVTEDGMFVYTGGIDNIIRKWDLRKGEEPEEEISSLHGHHDTITGLALSPDENYILSNSMDASLRMWNVRPFTNNKDRCEKVFSGAKHGAEKNLLKCAWSADQQMVTAGSSDRNVHIWEVDSADNMYCLPGHMGSVNDVAFHPLQPIIASGGTDRQIWLGELST